MHSQIIKFVQQRCFCFHLNVTRNYAYFYCGVAVYTMNEMERLKAKAMIFIGKDQRWMRCGWFYRDNCEEYYHQCGHSGYLPATKKNENGDPASAINNCLKGIFLGVSVDWKTGELPETSPFGPTRFYVPIDSLYGSDFNLYFADFYCHVGSNNHHLTLVLTRAASEEDNFCKYFLPKLNRMYNPFLRQDQFGWMHNRHTSVWIHVFYTEDILTRIGWLYRVYCKQASANTLKGKPKNASCIDCNI